MVTPETLPNGEINLLFCGSVWPLRAVFSRLNIDGAQSARGSMRFTRPLDFTNAFDLLYVDEIAAAIRPTFICGSLATAIHERLDSLRLQPSDSPAMIVSVSWAMFIYTGSTGQAYISTPCHLFTR